MKNLLLKNNKIIINTDLDGIFSGLVLHHYLGCDIVGFSNSNNCVWFDKTKIQSIYGGVYVDMFVPRPEVGCIDQHVVCCNARHHSLLSNNKNKINPNIENARFHEPTSSYILKYPFGAVHYIIATLASIGLHVNFDNSKINDNLNFYDLLLRADDAMKTTINSPYVENAKQWWHWLYNVSKRAQAVKSFADYLVSLSGNDVAAKKHDIKQILIQKFGCASPDGGYKNICNSSGSLSNNVKNYIEFLSKISKLKCFDLNLRLEEKIGVPHRIMLSEDLKNELIDFNTINGEHVFSYAFVRAAHRSQNFSYTVMPD